jgi:ADP-ribose pyrophosphatase YjhB (NUDIX family)
MNFDTVRRPFEPDIRKALHLYWRIARGLTVGVRAVVVDREGRIFLVAHSYVSGWHLPGGGVEPGEALGAALTRELQEEGNIELTGTPQLFGIYFNRRVTRRDHVALYVVRAFRQSAPPKPNHEIVAHGFFAIDALPEATTQATRARLAEVFSGQDKIDTW